MIKKGLSIIVLLLLTSGNFTTFAKTKSFELSTCPDCLVDALVLYHAHLNRTGDREFAIEGAASFYDDCVEDGWCYDE